MNKDINADVLNSIYSKVRCLEGQNAKNTAYSDETMINKIVNIIQYEIGNGENRNEI